MDSLSWRWLRYWSRIVAAVVGLLVTFVTTLASFLVVALFVTGEDVSWEVALASLVTGLMACALIMVLDREVRKGRPGVEVAEDLMMRSSRLKVLTDAGMDLGDRRHVQSVYQLRKHWMMPVAQIAAWWPVLQRLVDGNGRNKDGYGLDEGAYLTQCAKRGVRPETVLGYHALLPQAGRLNFETMAWAQEAGWSAEAHLLLEDQSKAAGQPLLAWAQQWVDEMPQPSAQAYLLAGFEFEEAKRLHRAGEGVAALQMMAALRAGLPRQYQGVSVQPTAEQLAAQIVV